MIQLDLCQQHADTAKKEMNFKIGYGFQNVPKFKYLF